VSQKKLAPTKRRTKTTALGRIVGRLARKKKKLRGGQTSQIHTKSPYDWKARKDEVPGFHKNTGKGERGLTYGGGGPGHNAGTASSKAGVCG